MLYQSMNKRMISIDLIFFEELTSKYSLFNFLHQVCRKIVKFLIPNFEQKSRITYLGTCHP